MNYAKLLRDIRRRKKFNQRDLAAKLYCCQSHVSLLERNRVEPSSMLRKIIYDYARRLRIDMDLYKGV